MEIFVYSRGAVERIEPHDVPHAIVSITSSPDDQARLPLSPHSRAVLRLSFADADRASGSITDEMLFSRSHARAIWETLADPDIERLIVHCDAGLCRSPAVAAAVVRSRGGDDEPYFRRYRPNMRVYRTLLEVFHDELSRGDPGAAR